MPHMWAHHKGVDMPAGIPFEMTENNMEDLILNNDGNCVKIAKHCKVSPQTIYRWFHNHPKMDKVLTDARNSQYECDLDLGEHVLRHCMNKVEENSGRALEAAKYLLNARGKKRGWTAESLDVAIEKRIREMQQKEMDMERKKYDEEHGIEGKTESDLE
jgi:hypothetical protein